MTTKREWWNMRTLIRGGLSFKKDFIHQKMMMSFAAMGGHSC